MNFDEIITEFNKYHKEVFDSYQGVNEKEIKNLEMKVKQALPDDFKDFLLISNGASINCHELYGIKTGIPAEDLFDNYLFETKEAGNPMPEYYLPRVEDS